MIKLHCPQNDEPFETVTNKDRDALPLGSTKNHVGIENEKKGDLGRFSLDDVYPISDELEIICKLNKKNWTLVLISLIILMYPRANQSSFRIEKKNWDI